MNTRLRRALFAVAWLLGASAVSHGQSNEGVAKQFIGMWVQSSWTEKLVDGTTRQNPLSVAHLIYTDTGRMCYVSMAENRRAWASAAAPSESEALSGMGNGAFYAYCATVEIHANEGFVLHHVDIDKVPNIVGNTRKRWFAFDGPNKLILRIDKAELRPPVVESTLVWERVRQ
jgi:hypothetical protein